VNQEGLPDASIAVIPNQHPQRDFQTEQGHAVLHRSDRAASTVAVAEPEEVVTDTWRDAQAEEPERWDGLS
jgi:hypothetical protein